MKANLIIVSVVKSNKSDNNVWAVAITGEEQKQAYCKSAYKAMKFAFKLKKRTGFYIEELSLKSLSDEIARHKAAKAAAEAGKEKLAEVAQEFIESHSVDAVLEQPAEEAKPKKQRKPRTKKVQAEPVVDMAPVYSGAESAEMIAFL